MMPEYDRALNQEPHRSHENYWRVIKYQMARIFLGLMLLNAVITTWPTGLMSRRRFARRRAAYIRFTPRQVAATGCWEVTTLQRAI